MDEDTLKEAMKIIGRRGGEARAAKMTAKQRSASAGKAGSFKSLKCECGKCSTCYQREYKRRWRAKVKK